MDRMQRNVRVFYFYIFLNRLEMWLPVIVLFLLHRGFSLTQYAIVDAVWYISTLAFEIPTGVITDRYGKKVSLLLGASFQSLSLFILAFGNSFPLLILAYVLWGFASSFETGTHAALIYDSLKQTKREEEYRKVMGRIRTLAIIAAAIGSVLAGYLGGIELRWPIISTAGVALLLGPLILLFTEPEVAEEREPSHLLHIKESIRFVVHRRLVALLIFYSSILGTAIWALYIFYQPLLSSFQVPVEGIGLLYLFFRLFAAAGAHFSDSVYRKIGRPSIYLIPTCFTLAVLSLGFWAEPGVIGFIFAIYFIDGLYYPIISDLLNRNLPSGKRATIISLGSVLACLMGAVLYPALGRIADLFSLQMVFQVLGFLLLLSMAPVLGLLKRESI